MLKKGFTSFFVLILSMVFMFSLSACGSDDASSEPKANEPVAAAEQPAPEPEVIIEVEECDEEELLRSLAVSYFNSLGNNNNNMVSAEDFKEQFELAPNSVVVLDIRRADDFAEGHLEGSINIPFGEVGNRIDEVPTNEEIAIVCYSGQTASQTAAVLRMAGFNTKIITGGFRAVEAEEFELVN